MTRTRGNRFVEQLLHWRAIYCRRTPGRGLNNRRASARNENLLVKTIASSAAINRCSQRPETHSECVNYNRRSAAAARLFIVLT